MRTRRGWLGQVPRAMLAAALVASAVIASGCAADTGGGQNGVASGGTGGNGGGSPADEGGVADSNAAGGSGGADGGSAGPDGGPGGSDGGSGGSSGGSGGSDGGSGGGSGGGLAGSAGNPFDDGGVVCFGDTVDPEPVEFEVVVEVPVVEEIPQPLAIYIMLDRSGSMGDPTDRNDPSSLPKWDSAVSSVRQFVNDPDSEHMDVALQYFPSTGATCDGAGYDTPDFDHGVAMGPLPDNADPISDSLATTGPQDQGWTPFEGAVRGATRFCAQFQVQNPDERCVVVLVSDGEPTTCNGDHGVLASVAQDAYNMSDVKTFTVGMEGASFPLLEQVAQWGGSDCTDGLEADTDGLFACDLTSGMTLVEALEAIREWETQIDYVEELRPEIRLQISECDWGIPDPPEDETFDKTMVNVQFTEPGMNPITIGKAADEAGCALVADGWYYDDEETPTTIIACPQTCEYIKSVVDGRIDIQFGCETELADLE